MFGITEIITLLLSLSGFGVQPNPKAPSADVSLQYAMPDPDVVVRTSGEVRVSNFLLWQLAYAELIFTDKLWPDFGPDDLRAAVAEYARRRRRFGGR